MTEPGSDAVAPVDVSGPDSLSAGGLLRAARERRGLHVAALAASIKVSPRKLEALEADRYDELPDMTFTRALAHTVCRALKVDATPVLAKLPHAGDLPRLAQLGAGLNAPFHGARGSHDPGEITFHRKPAFWATALVLLGALALSLMPEQWMAWRGAAKAPAVAASAPASASTTTSSPLPSLPLIVTAVPDRLRDAPGAPPHLPALAPAEPPIQTAPSAPPAVPAGPAAAATASVLALRTSAETWIDVKDARGQMLLSRNVQAGELVGLDGALPLRLVIGNAAATRLVFRGKPVDLAASTRENVARLQLP